MPLRRNRFAAWIAAIALVLQALWPLLSHARPKVPTLRVPTCTIDGVAHYLEIKARNTPLDERTALRGDHCQLCVFHGEKPIGLPSLSGIVFVVPDSRISNTVFRPVPPREPANHPPAHPRAPPELS